MTLEQIIHYQNLELLAKQMVEGFITGLHKSPYHGFSVEFAEHLLYNTGDDTKHIDWKVYARTDKLFTKRYEEETNLRCMMILDASSSMYYPREKNSISKLQFSSVAAACVAYMLQKQRDAVGYATFSDELEQLSKIGSTPRHIHNIFLDLQRLIDSGHTDKKSSIAKTINLLADKIHKRSLVIIFSDMLDSMGDFNELFSALQHLKYNNHEVILFHVHDKKTELLFNFEDKPHVFIDIESGDKVKLNPTEVKNLYREESQKFFQQLKVKCGQYKIDLIEADCSKDIDQVLLPYLIKRKKMR